MTDRQARARATPDRRLLLVGSDQEARSFLKRSLEARGYTVIATPLGDGVWQALEALRPHLIAINVEAGLVDPLDELMRIKGLVASDRFVPVLAIFPDHTPGQIVRGFTRGADDFLIRPFELFELVLRLEVLWRIKRLQDELLVTNHQLHELSITDDLTGLCNQTEFKRRMALEVKRVPRFGTPLSALFFDLDRFKLVNDTHGHAVGSYVLKEIARMLVDNLRETDVVGRYGGDEFVVGLPGCPLEDAIDVANRIRVFVEKNVFRRDDAEVSVTLSLGVAECSPQDDGNLERLLKRADVAMYMAKEAGRNRVCTLTPGDVVD